MSRSSRRRASRSSSDPGRPSETSSLSLERRAKVREAVPARKGAARDSVAGLVDELLAGNKRAAAKLISLIEDDEPEATDALARIFPHTGRAHVVGLTGPPGVGKSSLINRLVRKYRSRDRKVGVVAVDPTSPYTGGAGLGDRIPMADNRRGPGGFTPALATPPHARALA